MISPSRFSILVFPSGQKMRAAASFARTCSIGHSIEFAPSGAVFIAVQIAGSAHISPGTASPRCAQGSVGGSALIEQSERRDQRQPPHGRRPERRHLGGQRRANRTARQVGAIQVRLLQQRPHRQQPVQMRIQHRVAAIAAGEAGQ